MSSLAYNSGSYWDPFIKQAGFLCVGAFVCILTHNVPHQGFRFLVVLWFVVLLLLLAAIFSGHATNDANRWINFFGISFQPSELAKGALVGTIAHVLSHSREGKKMSRTAMRNVAFFTLPIVGLIFKENISTAVFLAGVVYVMMYVAGVPNDQMFKLTAAGLIALVLGVGALKIAPSNPDAPFYESVVGKYFRNRVPTAKERIFGKSLIITADPDSLVVTDRNMQVVHARIAVANNNHGIGRMPGNSVQRDYLPQAYSDFIYAIIVEETGIWGGGIVLILYLILLYRVGVTARKCGQNFAAYLVMGLGVLLVGQAMLNMCVAVGIGPVTGQTLPLISRGGTSTLITCFYFGMILSVSWNGVESDDKSLKLAPVTEPPVAKTVEIEEESEDESESEPETNSIELLTDIPEPENPQEES